MAIDGISSNGQGSYPMLDIDDAIAKARAMMARQEEANRDLRHTSEKLREAETAERIDLMHDAADAKFGAALIGAGCDAVSAGIELTGNADTCGGKGGESAAAAVKAGFGGFLTTQAANDETDAAEAESLASRFGSIAEDRSADVASAQKSAERLQDSYAAVERARAEARLAAARG
ncbi:MAG: hypothetical protein IPK60_18030 [Sandaracinaceae bacterium]|jgi:hypothetical protein|nr:hypothetical protein [Sandaracinaceae bacterium]